MTKITYNGKTTELADGYIATLPCKDLKMETDVVVEAPESEATLIPFSITENGTYIANDYNADGFSSVTVNVESGGGGAELNIAYGDTAPEDTSKLWVKTTQPSAVKVSSKLIKEANNNSSVETLSTTFADRRGYAIGSQVGNFLYIFGGNVSSYVNTIEKYNIANDTTTKLSVTLPYLLTDAVCISYGEDIYLFGGQHNQNATKLNTILKFNVPTETISTLNTKLPEARRTFGGALCGTKVYLFGGDTGSPSNTIYRYDIETDTIATLSTTVPTALAGIQAVNVGDFIYLFGGYPFTQQIFKFDCKTETIQTLSAKLPYASRGETPVVFEGNIYLFGGTNGGSNFNSILYFDVTTETLTTLSTTLPIRSFSFAYAKTEDCIYLAGGYEKTNMIYRFVPGMSIIVEVDNLQIHSALDKNIFNLINTDTIKAEIGVIAVYKGNAEGIGEQVEASLHNGATWVTI